jgi:hypothetical protein
MTGMPVALAPLFWSTLALAVALGVVSVSLVVQIVRGHISVTVPWGRGTVAVTERTVEIRAPRHRVVDALKSAARGRGQTDEQGEETRVLEEEDGLVVNESLTRSRYGLVHAVELVRIEPHRVAYRHLNGPLPGTEEEFILEDTQDGTSVRYRGTIPVSFWGLGRRVARRLIIPEYDRLIALHLDALRQTCESRAARAEERGSR